MKHMTNRILILVLAALLPSFALAGFNAYNQTGTRHNFIQLEDQFTWSGGMVRDLDEDTLYFEVLKKPRTPKYRIHYMKWEPVIANGHTIIYNHGIQSHTGWFIESAEKLAAMGYTVFAFDRIGAGRSSDGITVLSAEQSPEGVPTLLRGQGHIYHWKNYTRSIHLMKEIAKAAYPENKIHIWANSFAAHLVTAYMLEYHPDDVQTYIFTSPGLFSKLPLPFPVQDLIDAAPGTYFPTTIPEQNGDQGAYLFTSIRKYVRFITNDPKSLREFTKEFYFNVRDVQTYHFSLTGAPDASLKTRRFYLVVDGDPMMDTAATMNYIQRHAQNAAAKLYSGGPDHRHFLDFTVDVDESLDDIDDFIHGEPIEGNLLP